MIELTYLHGARVGLSDINVGYNTVAKRLKSDALLTLRNSSQPRHVGLVVTKKGAKDPQKHTQRHTRDNESPRVVFVHDHVGLILRGYDHRRHAGDEAGDAPDATPWNNWIRIGLHVHCSWTELRIVNPNSHRLVVGKCSRDYEVSLIADLYSARIIAASSSTSATGATVIQPRIVGVKLIIVAFAVVAFIALLLLIRGSARRTKGAPESTA